MEITIGILSGVILIAIFIIVNLFRKNEKLEDIALEKEKIITNFLETINFMDGELKKIDARGTFHSDDEIGFFFQRIKALQDILNSYFKK